LSRLLREASGFALLALALAVLFSAVTELRGRDYLACIILVFTGIWLLRAGVELLRPSVRD
jgi:hypothetical protein